MTRYDKVIKINPRYYEAWFNKGNDLVLLGKWKEAIDCYNEATDMYPEDPAAWLKKGHALKKLGRYEDAKACFKMGNED